MLSPTAPEPVPEPSRNPWFGTFPGTFPEPVVRKPPRHCPGTYIGKDPIAKAVGEKQNTYLNKYLRWIFPSGAVNWGSKNPNPLTSWPPFWTHLPPTFPTQGVKEAMSFHFDGLLGAGLGSWDIESGLLNWDVESQSKFPKCWSMLFGSNMWPRMMCHNFPETECEKTWVFFDSDWRI